MIACIIICLLSCIGLIGLVLTKPSVQIKRFTFSIYWLPAFFGAIVLLFSGLLPAQEAWSGLTASGDMNPIKILSLFLALTFLSVYLDELGFFRVLAFAMLKRAQGSQKKIFFFLYALVSVLTVFTSNDVVVLTFTPFICCFCKEENISPIPYLVAEFVAANTWSMALVIGNPTNIYLASTMGITFAQYFAKMWLPTLLAGLTALGVLYLLFHKQLSKTISPLCKQAEVTDRGLLYIGVAHLSGCVLCLAISSYVQLPMWLIAVAFAFSLCVWTLVYALSKRKIPSSGKLLASSVRRAPWELIPFVLSMFVIVLSLQKYGVTGEIAKLLSGNEQTQIFTYGVSSFLSANIVNNIPMSVLFGGVFHAASTLSEGAIYATVVGSNLGAYLTPVGALAGIMWTGLLKNHNVEFSFISFIKYGILLAVPSLLSALVGLLIIL